MKRSESKILTRINFNPFFSLDIIERKNRVPSINRTILHLFCSFVCLFHYNYWTVSPILMKLGKHFQHMKGISSKDFGLSDLWGEGTVETLFSNFKYLSLNSIKNSVGIFALVSWTLMLQCTKLSVFIIKIQSEAGSRYLRINRIICDIGGSSLSPSYNLLSIIQEKSREQ